MNAGQQIALQPAQLRQTATRLRDSDGRMQMAYAWYPEPDRIECVMLRPRRHRMRLRSGAAYRRAQFPASPRFSP